MTSAEKMNVLADKIAWVTGAASGIGLAAAQELARAGCTVVLSGRRRQALEEAARSIRADGGAAFVHALDVTDARAAAGVAQSAIAQHGRLDILINSAGHNAVNRYWGNVSQPDFASVVQTNLQGTFNCIAAVLPSMRSRGDGLVINIASWAGRHPNALTGPAYIASKHAVIALTHSFNIEEGANGLRACVIMPGEVNTPIMMQRSVPPSAHELARMLQPDDLGRVIRFVAEMPSTVCVNEILITPTANRTFAAARQALGAPSQK